MVYKSGIFRYKRKEDEVMCFEKFCDSLSHDINVEKEIPCIMRERISLIVILCATYRRYVILRKKKCKCPLYLLRKARERERDWRSVREFLNYLRLR